MDKDNLIALFAVVVSVLIGGGLALAGAQNGLEYRGIPVFFLLAAAAFLIQWAAFVPAFLFKTEKFYDLTGSITYVSLAILALAFQPALDSRSVLIAVFICVWAGRLGLFLFTRVMRAGEDSRFANVRGRFLRFLMAWSLQGLWIVFSMAAGLAAVTSHHPQPLDAFAVAGAVIWAAGFAIEILADAQKRKFRADPANRGRFIKTGLWSWSRHPNYFGEIVLWTGIAVMAFPVLQGLQHITLVSPVFVTILLTKISGIPLLEEAADKRWGGQPEYEAYKRTTSVLVLRPPRQAATV